MSSREEWAKKWYTKAELGAEAVWNRGDRLVVGVSRQTSV